MKYQIINEELKIAACGIAGLTMDQIKCFLNQWEDGANIGSLTMFYDTGSGLLVLNRDNVNYASYRDLAVSYLVAGNAERQECRERAPESMRETLNVLDSCIKWRTTQREIFRAKQNLISENFRGVLNEIVRSSNNAGMPSACIAFRYGMMCGKREERARRKAGAERAND